MEKATNKLIDNKQEETIINKIIQQANDKCKSIESIKDINEILKKYYVLEETLITQIKILENDFSYLKDKIYTLLYENFFHENDINLFQQKCDYEKAVIKSFFDYYFGKDIIGEIKKIFLADEDKDFGIEKKEILYKIQKALLLQAVVYVKNNINYETISIFIFNSIRKLFIIKIEETLIQLYQFKVVTEPFLISQQFEYLKNTFTSIFHGKLEIFDKTIFKEEEKILFFRILVLTNWKYINNCEKNSKIFYNNLKNYITLIGLKEKFNDMVGECRKIIEVTDSEIIKSNLEKIKEEISNLSEEKYLLFILSFSIMLNSLSSILNKKKISEQNEILPVPKLKCSSKERQFLIHLLLTFNAIKINYYLETLIYQQILKSYNKELYNSTFQRKEIIKFEQIIKDITSLSNRKNNNETSLNDLEINVISNYFGKFIRNKSGVFENQDFSIPILFKNKSIYSLIKYDVNKLALYPLSHIKTSSQICILIDGTFTNEINLRHTLSCYLYQNMNSNCDFYTYKWQSSINISDIDNNKKVAKFFGKFLAYIITSRTVFKFQCINIIGFSFGCHVIKHFLLEFNKISGKIDTDDILNDVIFIGAATDLNMDKYPNILNNIGGRIVNIFSEKDKDLRDYDENSMGLKMLVNNTPYKTSYSIINVNLSKKNISQDDYFNEITRIINEKIKLY